MSVIYSKAEVKLTLKPWMTNSHIKNVLEALNGEGKEARFVGGCVRDGLLKIPVQDVDLATPERPEKVITLLEAANIKVVPTGIKHGTVTAVIADKKYEITSLRIDMKTDGRHASVDFTDDWKQDAMRRDFTVNALSACPKGNVYDYVSGLQDLLEGRIRFIGLAEEKIKEDHLRILRYFRFIAANGFKNEDNKTHQICVNNSYLLAHLSGERIRNELFKILVSANHNDGMGMMIRDGVTKHFLPEAISSNYFNNLLRVENFVAEYEKVRINPIRRLATLINTDKSVADSIYKRLHISNKQRDYLKRLILPNWNAEWHIKNKELRAAIYQHGPEYVIDLCLIKWARLLKDIYWLPQKQTNAWLRIINFANQWKQSSFPIKGQDIVDLGIKEGPEISHTLNQLELWWINRGCFDDRATCLKKLEQLLTHNQFK